MRRKSVLNIHWKDWCWSWNSNTLATWCKELTHWKRPWCWERLKARGEGDDRGWDGWTASSTRWAWVWASSRSWWWTGKLGVLQVHGAAKRWTQLSDWTELRRKLNLYFSQNRAPDLPRPLGDTVDHIILWWRTLILPIVGFTGARA